MLAISLAIKAASAAWDSANVTVAEVQENIDELSSSISTLQSEYNTLKSKDFSGLTESEKSRLSYLETRIAREKELLELENARLIREKYGNKFTDWFDEENANSQYKDFHKKYLKKDSSVDDYYYYLEQIEEAEKYRQEAIDNGDEEYAKNQLGIISAYEEYADKEINNLELELQDYKSAKGEAEKAIEQAKADLKNPNLTEEDKHNVEKNLKDWQDGLKEINYLIDIIKNIPPIKLRLENSFQQELEEAAAEFSDKNLSDFFKEKSIDTKEELSYFQTVTEGAESAEDAINMYNKAIAKTEDSGFEPFDVEDFKSTLNQIQSGYQSLIDAKKEYEDNGGFLSPNTIASLIESGLIDYLDTVEGKIKFNTDAYLENAEVMKQNAIISLYNGMCHDINAAAVGNMSEIAPMAKVAIDNLNASTKQGGEVGEQFAIGMIKAGAGVDVFLSRFGSDEAKKATGETLNQIGAIFSTYQKAIQLVDGYDIGASVKSKSSSSGSKKAEKSMEDIQKKWKEYLDKYLALYKAELDAGLIDFNTFINKSRNLLDEYYRDAKISGKDYFDSLKSLYETQLSLYDKVLSAVSKRFDKEIQKYQDMIDAVNKQNEALEKQKEDYNGILDAIDSVYEKEIERIESEKQAIQDQIDAIQDEADAYEQLKQKEEALYNLERAQSQRTKKVYTEQKGYIYTQDGEAIREAQDSLNDIETESKINDLKKQQDALDETIDKLNEYKDKWAEIPEAHQNALNKELALAMFGKDFEKLILENRITDIEIFKDKYVAVEQQIQDNTLLIESYEEKIAYYEGLKEQWSQISSAYEEETEKQLAAMFLGEDWEQKILSGRLDTLNDFKDEYRRIQQEIVNLAWESANAQIKADEEAKKGADGTKGSTTLTNSPNTNNFKPDSDTKKPKYTSPVFKQQIDSGAPSSPNSLVTKNHNSSSGGKDKQTYISKYAKGGVLREAKPAHPIFEKLAREMGEDHIATIAFKEGERILTPEQNQLFENTVKNIFPNLEKMINLSDAKPFVPNPSALNKQRVEITQNINVTLPNITNETGFENFKKEMDTFKLQAYQFANRRYR